MYIPQRGDLIWISFDPQAGHEQRGKRPALVLSHDGFNRTMGFAYVCPISNTKRRNPFYVRLPEDLSVTGVIMADQMRSLDFRARTASLICSCPDLVLQDVLRRIKPVLF
ncbi:type II toxin-antitoxin system PemK/MazF family toxin [Synechococcales cyanobacterium C]|uniref:Type II toxin-antitoxin system PemK/MazF family toxin n=1 Tax=Petrachloros mirabilis ULC683 TaxID=2781853 RepID=A0A8K1ZVY5_9CYAN|nr:type II toxin-antitoxin system PemK/MazF family toxin [Petrachloros mirabilis]NCJ05146.1 type II toxin-antitoxin system PemK/MazF family toxin [Petrachloros mirabilis ULC683]